MKHVLYILFLTNFTWLLAQNHAPQVSNVTFEQRMDGSHKVDIYYDLYDADGDAMTVTMQASNDAGTTWDVSCKQISGDVGENIMSGNDKHIVWDFGAEHPDVYWDKVQIKITADDGHFTPGLVEMIYVAGGTFQMGDTWGDGGSDEKPVHTVAVNSFYMGKYEVTNAQVVDVFNWALAQGKITASSSTVKNTEGNQHELLDLDDGDCQISYNGSQLYVENNYDNYPVIEISWYGAAAFCNYLSEREGLTPVYDLSNWSANWSANGYRLPTEAEWEYAAKGGANGNNTKYSGSNNVDAVAWYWDNSNATGNSNLYNGHGTLPIGTKQANELGIYDMSGNVYEWCWDWYDYYYYSNSPQDNPKGPSSGSRRVLRGGSWAIDAYYVRVASRFSHDPDDAYRDGYGFRLLRTP